MSAVVDWLAEKRPFNKNNRKEILRWGTHVGALLPLVRLYWRFSSNNLGVDPVREILFFTGITSLVLLVLSLAVTPISFIFGFKQIIPLRRLLGLYTFFYTCLHFLTFLWLDYAFEWDFIVGGILEQRFVLVGFAAWLLLLPLALTSNRWSQKKLKKRWKTLHKLVYVIVILALIHFFWLVRNVYVEPTIYAIIVGMLLLTRVKPVRQYIVKQRRNWLKR